MYPEEMLERAETLLEELRRAGLTVATVESCTGGLVAGLLTAIPGSSDVVDRGYVTYSNEAKQEMVGVPAALLQAHGAVSRQVAEAMAAGALERCPADLAVSITGVAGPGGGSAEKPVGLVHFALARRGAPLRHRAEQLPGDRTAVRLASVGVALDLLRTSLA